MDPNFQIQQDPFSGYTPPTIASAASITPRTQLSFISGTVPIANIVPPLNAPHILSFIFTDPSPGGFLASGNIATTFAGVQNKIALLQYEPRTRKYYSPGAVDATVLGEFFYVKSPSPNLPNAIALDTLDSGVLRVSAFTGDITTVNCGANLQFSATPFNPGDNNTYYFGNVPLDPTQIDGRFTVVAPISGVITRAFLIAYVNGGLGGAQLVTLRVRNVSDNTDALINNSPWSAQVNISQNLSMIFPVAAGDLLSLQVDTPAFAPNPTQVTLSGSLWIESL